MNFYFTSDEHHGHENIIKYCNRPFKNADEMMNTIIQNHNDVVKEDDIVYHLGDLSMYGSDMVPFYRKLMKKYRPVKARYLILGNHDRLLPFTYCDLGFTSVHTSLTFRDFLLAHDPCVFQSAIWDKFAWMLCGHVHNLFKIMVGQPVINIGVDVWNFKPVSYEEAISCIGSF